MSHELCIDESPSDPSPANAEGADGDPTIASVSGSRIAQHVRRGRTFAITVGVAFAIVFLQLVQGILLARLLGPEGRGEYAAAILYVQMLLYVGLLGGVEVVCRYAADAQFDRQQLRRAAMWLGITTGVITTLLVILLNLVALPAEKRFLIPLACLCSLSVIGQQVMLIMTAVDRGAGAFGRYNARRIFAAAIFPALMLMCVPFLNIDPLVAAVLFVVASTLGMGACIIGLANPFRGECRPRVPQLLRESRPYGLSMFVTDLFERLDLLLVLWLAPLVTQGLYAAMVPAVYPLTVIPNTLGLFLFNAGASRTSQLKVRDIHRILASSLLVQLLSTGAFMLVIGTVIRFVYGDEFSSGVIFALWLAPVAALRGIIQGLDSYLKGRGRPLAPINSRIVAAVIMLAVTWLLYPTMQTLAIPVAAIVGQAICLVWLSAIVYADVRHVAPASD